MRPHFFTAAQRRTLDILSQAIKPGGTSINSTVLVASSRTLVVLYRLGIIRDYCEASRRGFLSMIPDINQSVFQVRFDAKLVKQALEKKKENSNYYWCDGELLPTATIAKRYDLKACTLRSRLAKEGIENGNQIPPRLLLPRLQYDQSMRHFATINGVTKLVSTWCDEIGAPGSPIKVSYKLAIDRINAGIDSEKALTTPPHGFSRGFNHKSTQEQKVEPQKKPPSCINPDIESYLSLPRNALEIRSRFPSISVAQIKEWERMGYIIQVQPLDEPIIQWRLNA